MIPNDPITDYMFIEQHRGNTIEHFIMHRIFFPTDVIVFDHNKRFSGIFSSRSISIIVLFVVSYLCQ